MSRTNEATLQSVPDMVTAPTIKIETAEALVGNLYKLHVKNIKELYSYYDKNYRIEVDPTTENPFIMNVSKTGYVLKIYNRMDSLHQHYAGEDEMSSVLTNAGIVCPEPELNIYGERSSLQELPIEAHLEENDIEEKSGKSQSLHLVRLMKFIPGEVLYSIPYTPEILMQSGEQLGRITKALQNFTHPQLEEYVSEWSLTNLHKLTNCLYAVQNESDRKLVLEIIEAFQREVEPNYHKFKAGIIHGDYNDHNIIVAKSLDEKKNQENKTEYNVAGVIDFGDSHQGYIVMEVAIAIMYHMLESKVIDPLDVGGYILKGYYKNASLNNAEKEVLKILVAGRYCQSLVLGAYSYMQDPGNEYLLVTAKQGWPQLRKLWGLTKDELYNRWQIVLDK